MKPFADPDPSVLGHILLLQSTIQAAPDEKRLAEMLTRGLAALPGIHHAVVCIGGCAFVSAKHGTQELFPYGAASKNPKAFLENCPVECPIEQERGWPCFPLSTSKCKYGAFFLECGDLTVFTPYEPFVTNTANLVALHIENTRHKTALGILNVDLERQISERTKTLREREHKYRLLADNATDVIWSLDMDLKFTYISPSVQKLRGYTPKEAVQLPLEKTLTPESYQKMVQTIAKELKRENEPGVSADRSVSMELSMIRKDGSTVLVEVHASFLRDETGVPNGIIGITRDIRERKRAEGALRESEKRFRTLFDTSPQAIALTEIDTGKILDVNDTFCRLSKSEKKELIGKTTTELGFYSQNDRDRVIQELTDHGKVNGLEMDFKISDGSIVNSRMFAVTINIDGTSFLLTAFFDVTELNRLEAKLRQSQKMESVGRLAGGVAHDFNNMLSVILGHTEMALEEMNSSAPLYAVLMEIRKAAQRSADITRQLLAFARKQTISPKLLDLNKTVESMLKMLRRLIGENVQLTWMPHKDPVLVKMDPSQIDQILANLCVNARDAIKDVGRIIIETGKTTIDKAYCRKHQGFLPGDYVLLAVNDNGLGMDKETLNSIFEPFFTTKGVGQGTGLGLSTVYGIVKQNSGFINVISEPGQGTSFRIYLPPPMEKSKAVRKTGESIQPAPRGKETILLVEDEPATLKMITMMLEQQGYRVMAVGFPGEAIRMAGAHPNRIDLLMTDVVMPEMNGRELARNIQSVFPDIKRLFMSGYPANVIAHHGVLDSGVNFIQKPFSMKDLASKVRQTLDEDNR